MDQPVIAMDHASLDFGNGAGVFDLTFQLAPGTILGLIGPSGSGKTTLVRLLTGMYRPTSGTVRVFGKNPLDFKRQDKLKMGYIPQQLILYPHLSAEENLAYLGGLYGLSPLESKRRMDTQLQFVELCDARKRLVSQLSGGMKRRLMLAGALLHDPLLIFADEPTAGIDPILRERIWENFAALRDEHRTLLVTTQYVGEAAYCDQVAVLREGQLIALDTPGNLRLRSIGGEIIILRVEARYYFQAMQFLSEQPEVIKVEQVENGAPKIRILVENAGRDLPVLLSALAQQSIPTLSAEPDQAPFDEVFVRLIKQVEAQQEVGEAQ